MEASIRPRPSLTAGSPPSEIVARLVALNASRAAEEAAGTIRWLRPNYQRPRFGD